MLSRLQRASLMAIGAQVSVLLEQDDAERVAAASAKVADADPAKCQHPDDKLVPAPAMGHPNAKICAACGTTVEA